MTTYSYELRIPKNRIAVLIGKKGEIKKRLEEETKTKIKVDSEEGEVFVEGKDPVKLLEIREVIRAIGRGFNPEVAQSLLKQDYSLEIIEIPQTKSHLERIKGRVIGSEGKTRRTIEDLTNCQISVFGKTIAIIGFAENVLFAKRAVDMLLQGSTHANVYKFLEKRRRDLKHSLKI